MSQISAANQTDARDPVIVGFSMDGGGVARYTSRHNGKSVAKAVLVSATRKKRLTTDLRDFLKHGKQREQSTRQFYEHFK